MPKTKAKQNNLQLAGIFLAVVLGLVVMSFAVKLLFVVKESKFDGSHEFNVVFTGINEQDVVSFSPQNRSISILKINNKIDNPVKALGVPVDGVIRVKGNINTKNLSTLLFKSEFPLGQKVEKLTFLDLLRLGLFSRTVVSDSVYQREFSDDLTSAQKNTLVSLTFNDPTIYEENLSIEIINAASVNGLGTKLANFITNIGGNTVLISGGDSPEDKSKIIYSGKMSYTVKRLASYFNLPKEQADKRGIADVIIIIGKGFIGKL
jgi:hypothetical protein